MPTNVTVAWSEISDAFHGTSFLGAQAVLGAFVILLTLILITRNTNRWKQLLLPVAIGWSVVGLEISIIIYIIGAILMAIDALTPQTMSNVMRAVTQAAPMRKGEYKEASKEIAKKTRGILGRLFGGGP